MLDCPRERLGTGRGKPRAVRRPVAVGPVRGTLPPVRWLTLLLLVATAAFGQEPDPEAVAVRAQQVWDAHCVDADLEDTTVAAAALAEVTPVWNQVVQTHAATGAYYLLYWRGVLGACIGQEDRAEADLQAFVEQNAGRTTYESLVQDAKRRLRLLRAGKEAGTAATRKKADPVAGGVVLGGVLLGGAGAAGAASAVRWTDALAIAEDLYANSYSGDPLTQKGEAGDAAAFQSQVLVAGAAVLSVGAFVSFGISAGRAKKRDEEARGVAWMPSVAVAPTRGGFALSVGGSW
jgi:hypothetical protein